jgi:hypothetical protein
MVDIVDMAVDIEAEHLTRGIARAAVPVPPGNPGECECCDWWMPRLVEGLCAFCRDGRPRPSDWEPPTPPTSAATITPLAAQEESTMPAKTVCLPASAAVAITCLEAHAKNMGLSLGAAAAELIERGADKVLLHGAEVDQLRPVPVQELEIDVLVAEVSRRLLAAADASDLTDDLAEMTARAEAAEAQIAEAKLKAQALFA